MALARSPDRKVHPLLQFQALGLSPVLVKTVQKLGFETPTPIQSQAIPIVLQGRDLMGLAQTGTGKTAAFGLPLIQNLLAANGKPDPKTVRSLILAPTRELVNQITGNLRSFVRGSPLRVTSVVGGASIGMQIRDMARGADILVATPGRLLDLTERKAVFLDTAKFLVLDEADQMLDLGFIHSLRTIAGLIGTPRQTLLFSATMPKQIEELARVYLHNPERVQVAPAGRAADKIRQSVHFIGQSEKTSLLKKCLAERPGDLSLVFARTKHGAEKLMQHLVDCGFPAGSIHGNKSQGQRDRAIRAFRNGEIRVLVATDVAARGIDIPGVSHVYNYDLPEVPENYVHRIGRTARAGADGEAVAFCCAAEIRQLRDIERLMGLAIEVASGEVPRYEHAKLANSKRRGQGQNHSNGRGKQQRQPGQDHKSVGARPTIGQKQGHGEQRERRSSEAGGATVERNSRSNHNNAGARNNRPGWGRKNKRKSVAA